jgi:hypothetical protein
MKHHAGALAIGGFVRSRWRGGRGGAMGFAGAIRDLFVELEGWTSWRGESVAAAIAAKRRSGEDDLRKLGRDGSGEQ